MAEAAAHPAPQQSEPPPPTPPSVQAGDLPPRPPSEDESMGGLVRESLAALATMFGYFALNYVTNIVFARILSPADYGDYAIGMTTLALGSLVALAGAASASTRYLPDYLARQDYARLSGYIRFFVPVAIAASLVIGTGVWAVHGVSLAVGYIDELHPVAIAAVVIAFYALANFGARLLRSFGFVLGSFLPTNLIAPLAALALVAALHFLGIAVTDWLVMAAVGAGFVLAIAFEVVALTMRGQHRLLRHKPAYEIHVWLAAALPMMVAGILSEVTHQSDLLMIELVAQGEHLVGHYAAINSTVVVLTLIASAVTGVISPLLGAAIGTRDAARIQTLLGNASTLVFVGCGVGTLLIILLRTELLGLFGPSYRDATTALAIAALAYGIGGAFGFTRLYLQYLGHHRATLWPMVFGVFLNIALNALLIPPFGINGAATATFVALVSIRLIQAALLYYATGLVELPFCRGLSARAVRLGVV